MLYRLFLAIGLLLLPTSLSAQTCSGLPWGRGLLAIGFQGTDGATGRGGSFAYQGAEGSARIDFSSLDTFALIDRQETFSVTLTRALPQVRLPLCLSVGVERTGYRADRTESISQSADNPDLLIERQRLIGAYRRWRLPVTLDLGHQLTFARTIELVPSLRAGVAYEAEHLRSIGGPVSRDAVGPVLGASLTAAWDWFVIRADVDHTWTRDSTLSRFNNFPILAAQLGVRF